MATRALPLCTRAEPLPCRQRQCALAAKSLDDLERCHQATSPKAASAECARYAELEARCEPTSDGYAVDRAEAAKMCERARADPRSIAATIIAPQVKCAQTTTDCAAYLACLPKDGAASEHETDLEIDPS